MYYVDPATPAMWVPYVKKGIEDWQPAFERGGVPQRDRREGRAGRRSGLESRRRALLGDSVAAVDHPERFGPEHPRPAHWRDSRGRHPVLSQRPEPVEELVLRAGGAARSARAAPSAARRSHGRADSVRRRARSGAHARLPAQHEGERDVLARAGARQAVGEDRTATRRR